MNDAQGKAPLPSRKQKVPTEKKGWFWKTTWITLLSLFLLAGGYTMYLFFQLDVMLGEISQPVNPNSPDESVIDSPVEDGQPVTYLLMGLDARPNLALMNTDVIMIVSFHPQNRTATVVSIPRDARMTYSERRFEKANAIYAIAHRNDRDTAMETVKQVFGDFMQIKIDHVAITDFTGFEAVVNRLGGLSIDVEYNMCYVDNADGTNINLKAGKQKLDGREALDYIRYRQSNCNPLTRASNDMERNLRQQLVLDKVKSRMLSVGGVLQISGIIDDLGENLRMDASKSQLRDMIRHYTLSLSRSEITYLAIDGTWRSPYLYLDETQLQEARIALQLQVM